MNISLKTKIDIFIVSSKQKKYFKVSSKQKKIEVFKKWLDLSRFVFHRRRHRGARKRQKLVLMNSSIEEH